MSDQQQKRISRLLPGLTTEYTIVSMPAWAWEWLDPMVNKLFVHGYKDFIRECAGYSQGQSTLSEVLENFAWLLREDYYRLTNDNWPPDQVLETLPVARKPAYNFPQAHKLFSFMPFATSWENVLIRRGLSRSPSSSY